MVAALSLAKRLLPRPVGSGMHVLLKKLFFNNRDDYYYTMLARLGLATEFSAYDKLIDYIEANKIHELKGDFLEIGAFLGGGTAKLAKYAAPHNKSVHVVDVFDPGFDATPNIHGQPLNELYRLAVGRKSQRDIFDRNTKFTRNIVVYAKDSKLVKLTPDVQLCFSFIDGNHDPDYVRSDFYFAWNSTVSGGAVGIHDYVVGGGDLPQVTNAVDQLIAANRATIRDTQCIPDASIIVIRKQ